MSVPHSGSFADLKETLSQYGEFGDNAVIPFQVKARTHSLCSNLLGGIWKELEIEDIQMKRMKGGMSNMLFLCQLPADRKPIHDEPERVLLRVYFNPETENHLVAESVIFTLLSERQLGPRLYGIFNGGRLEEYIVSRPLHCWEIRVPEVSMEIAQKLALIHQLSVPISKEPHYLCEALDRWARQLLKIRNNNDTKLRLPFTTDTCLQMNFSDLRLELDIIRACLKHSKSPVVFSHNDLQEGNILLPEKGSTDKDLVFIDFEYASYNYRAFDFANHFCEWSIDYAVDQPPYFKITMEDFPKEEDQARFIRAYLKASGNVQEITEELVHEVLMQVRAFVPVSHFFWGVWALLQVELSPVNFGFAEYGRKRLGLYFELKADLLKLLKDAKGEEVANGEMELLEVPKPCLFRIGAESSEDLTLIVPQK